MKLALGLASVGLSLLALATGARATIVVDAAGGGDFTSLAEALFVAADGEQILVKSGSYDGIGFLLPQVWGKGLSICADAGADVVIGGLGIGNVPAGHWVIVRGLTIDATLFGDAAPDASVVFHGPTGAVWLEDCTIRGGNGLAHTFGGTFAPQAAVKADSGGSVSLHRCTLTGGNGWAFTTGFNTFQAGPGAPAVHANGGRVALHDCTLTGGQGGSGEQFPGSASGAKGAPALRVDFDGVVHVAGSSLTGGSNGDNLLTATDTAGDGLFVNSGSVALRDSTVQPGTIVNAGLPGQAIVAPPGAVTTLSEPARSIAVSSPLREGEVGTLQIQGLQGDQVLLLVALGSGYAPLPSKQGVFVLDTSVLFLPIALGSISDPGGALALPFVTPNLNPALQGLTVPMQLAVVHGGVTTIEGGTALGWLDSSL